MSNSVCNFFVSSAFNANFDITWSFQYSITGSNTSSGGFSTFLFNNHTLNHGGRYTGLGYAPYQSDNGVDGAIIGVLLDNNNRITIKNGTNFSTITSFNLNQYLYPLIKTNVEYNTLRFNFTNVGQTLKIAYKNQDNKYIDLVSANTGVKVKDNDFYYIGFGYASPIRSGDSKIALSLKNIHVQGNTRVPTIIYNPKPSVIPTIDTFYIIQSPLSGDINIGNPDPVSIGSLIHN